MQKRWIASVLALATAGLLAANAWGTDRSGAACGQLTGGTTRLLGFAATSAVPAEVAGRLALVRAGAATPTGPATDGVVRHVAADTRFGVAYVQDLAGPDVVVIDRPQGEVRLKASGEAANPSWSPTGDVVWAETPGLRVWSAKTIGLRSIRSPERGSLVFSPVFAGPDTIVAAVSEPPTVAIPEGEYLSNLWRYDLGSRAWTQLTHFGHGANTWSIVRTPVVGTAGTVEFVRMTGDATATVAPSFELWRLDGDHAVRERVLPSERYLAGYQGGARLWNLPDEAAATWQIAREEPSGQLTQIGCGAVLVDPYDVGDPDRSTTLARTGPSPAPSPSPSTSPSPSSSPSRSTSGMAILVGDFAWQQDAQAAATTISDQYGPTATVRVIDSTTSPTAIRPGVWAAVLLLAPGTDLEAELQSFRSRLPQFSDSSWVVAP